MSPLSIVAVAVFATLFALLLLASAAAMIYAHLQLRRQISAISTSLTEHRSSLQLTVRDIGVTLDSHRVKMDGLIENINGQEIAQAAKAIIACTQRIEKATVAFAELARHLLSEEALGGDSGLSRTAASGLAPDSFAPNPTNERYTGISSTTQGDIEAGDEREDPDYGIEP